MKNLLGRQSAGIGVSDEKVYGISKKLLRKAPVKRRLNPAVLDESDKGDSQEEIVFSSIASAASLQRKSLLTSTSQASVPTLNPRSMTAQILLEKEKGLHSVPYLDVFSSIQQSTSSVDRAKEISLPAKEV